MTISKYKNKKIQKIKNAQKEKKMQKKFANK